jgi:hypothetical protein
MSDNWDSALYYKDTEKNKDKELKSGPYFYAVARN